MIKLRVFVLKKAIGCFKFLGIIVTSCLNTFPNFARPKRKIMFGIERIIRLNFGALKGLVKERIIIYVTIFQIN
jgi:hypothetical protein